MYLQIGESNVTSFSISYPDSAFTDPENYFTWGIVIHQCYIKNVISYIVEEE